MDGVPSRGEETGRGQGRKRDGRGSLTKGRNEPETGENRDRRGSLTKGRNGPETGEKSGMEARSGAEPESEVDRERDWNRNELCSSVARFLTTKYKNMIKSDQKEKLTRCMIIGIV
jgi:hypothetical protein